MKLYITKFALTQGIIEIDNSNEQLKDNGNRYYGPLQKGFLPNLWYKGKDIFDNLDDAIKVSDEIKLKKIESLKKNILKLETKKIKVKYATV